MKPTETVDYHIKFLWHSISNLYNQIAQEFDLTQATGYALLNIDSNEGVAATKIAPLMGMKATSLSRMLKKMEGDNLIYKKKCENDGRSVKIHLTEKGLKKKKIARNVVLEFNEYMLERIDQSDLKQYFETMRSITKITEDYKNLKLT
ncbi:MAG: DNA-binding MarR family transcriptional regulator [Vicingaceae bacterium]|jgi:DNA-binding MarR family transcriptional regulator|tara:strand:- start:252 stop:695 length:444 start_codon:yes stop_codon:yes gene_type:complete